MQLGLLGAWRITFGLMQSEHLHPLLADYNREHRQTVEQVQFENKIIFRDMAISSTILSTIRNFALQTANTLIGLNDRMAASSTLEGLKVNTIQSFDYWILPQIEHLSNFQCCEIGAIPPVEVISQLLTYLNSTYSVSINKN